MIDDGAFVLSNVVLASEQIICTITAMMLPVACIGQKISLNSKSIDCCIFLSVVLGALSHPAPPHPAAKDMCLQKAHPFPMTT